MVPTPPAPPSVATPAQRLEGRTIEGGWKVVRLISRAAGQTGGYFSVGYELQGPGGSRAYLKALDYVRAFAGTDPASVLNRMTADHLFERGLLEFCREKRMSRIVRALGYGSENVDHSMGGLGVVQYLIFERADRDLREKFNPVSEIELATVYKVLHEVASGLLQLHAHGVAHQDIRPSNILEFDEGQRLKIADLGRSISRSAQAPHENDAIAGARSYAPPEYQYRYIPPEWNERRFGADLYLLGSLGIFLICGFSANALLEMELAPEHSWNTWRGTFQEVLPYLLDAHARVMATMSKVIPASHGELTELLAFLTNPNPARRGHPRSLAEHSNKQSLERFISRFNALTAAARAAVIRRGP